MGEKLRSGFTTGTCAAAAGKAAAAILCSRQIMSWVQVKTADGTNVNMELVQVKQEENKVYCAVKKDAGDDPDITNGALIGAWAEWISEEEAKKAYKKCYIKHTKTKGVICLAGGEGVGTATKKGLSCPVGLPAINPVPRENIFTHVEEVKNRWNITRPIKITIVVPKGRRLAEKTFNPRLGIIGGISILGTTGIVKPMSEDALISSICLEIHQKAAEGLEKMILTPGNYGERFLKEELLISLENAVRCSNYVEKSVKAMAGEGFKKGLFAGHVGKLIKVAGGAGNTHSKYGDRRMEILCQCARKCWEGPEAFPPELEQQILESNTTEEAAEYLNQAGIYRKTGDAAALQIREQILNWTDGRLCMTVVLFSQEKGIMGIAGDIYEYRGY